MEVYQLKEFEKRLEKLEKQGLQDVITLVEIMSNITFFGGLKKENCKYAEQGQCSLFVLEGVTKNRIPIATNCRLKSCKGMPPHYHLELSNTMCTFCPNWHNGK